MKSLSLSRTLATIAPSQRATQSDYRSKHPDVAQRSAIPVGPPPAQPTFGGISHDLLVARPTPVTPTFGGQSLPAVAQQRMEAAFNTDFTDVRIHEGSEVEQMGALAYTRGSHIHFAPGQYRLQHQRGWQLLGHELAHVVQQRAGRVPRPATPGLPINPDRHLEAEADRAGAQAAAGQAVTIAGVQTNTAQPLAPSTPIQLAKRKKFKDKDIDPRGPNISNIASGAINQVDLVTYKEPIGSRSRTGFFKADLATGEDMGGAALGIGIDPQDQRAANRAVATSRMAALLQDTSGNGPGSVIAATVFANHNQKAGTVSEQASGKPIQKGVDLKITRKEDVENLKYYSENPADFPDFHKKYRSGDPGKKVHISQKQNPLGEDEYEQADEFYNINGHLYYHQFDFTNPITQRGLLDLQLMDALTGQVDRHLGNIFIDPTTGQVTGIDNDAAFGSQNSDHPHQLLRTNFGDMRGSHNKGLPPLVDENTAQMVLNLKPEKVKKQLKNLLSDPEIEATLSRLADIKQHIENLYTTGHVVGAPLQNVEGRVVSHPLAWGNETFKMAMQAGQDSSYLEQAVTRYNEELKKGGQYAEGGWLKHKLQHNPPPNAFPAVGARLKIGNRPPQISNNHPLLPPVAPPLGNANPVHPNAHRIVTGAARQKALDDAQTKFAQGSYADDFLRRLKRENRRD